MNWAGGKIPVYRLSTYIIIPASIPSPCWTNQKCKVARLSTYRFGRKLLRTVFIPPTGQDWSILSRIPSYNDMLNTFKQNRCSGRLLTGKPTQILFAFIKLQLQLQLLLLRSLSISITIFVANLSLLQPWFPTFNNSWHLLTK